MSELDFLGFESRIIATDASEVFVHRGPLTGPALLLLHGFPRDRVDVARGGAAALG
jgi:hypothetical protein